MQNLDKIPASTNIELDCLGKRVAINSPEAGAAAACMDDVAKAREVLRQVAIESYSGPKQANNALSVESLENRLDNLFTQTEQSYVESKSTAQGFGSWFKSSKDDTFANREKEFFDQLVHDIGHRQAAQ
jgi:hypothetical protein